MASIISRTGGRHEIQLRVGAARHTIRLGKISRRVAEGIKTKIEALAAAAELGIEPDIEVAAWLERSVSPSLRKRLVRAGLALEKSVAKKWTLQDQVEVFLSEYRSGSSETKETIRVALSRVVAAFGGDRLIRSITVREAQDVRRAWAESGDFAEATVSTTVKKSRQLWKAALKAGIVDENIWLEVEAGSQENLDRAEYISRETTEKLIAQCSTPEWKLIIALARYAGLRCPSELKRLRRGDINWAADRFRVRGKGKRDRIVPIFPDLRPYLEAVESESSPSATYVIANRRNVSSTTWRRQMLQWIAMAGIKQPWPRLFHNLRSSCETDLVHAGHSIHVVGRWLGHTEAIARRHYLQVTEQDFQKALKSDVKTDERNAQKSRRRQDAG